MTRKEEIERLNNLISLIKENATEIRKNLKYISDADLEEESHKVLKLFDEIDVYRQHTDFLRYKAKHPEEF